MIGQALVFLRKRLDAYLRAELGGSPDDPVADRAVFVDGDKLDPLVLQEGAVSELIVNVEEERLHRGADPWVTVRDDGKPQRKRPDVRLGLYVLFVAKFKQYELAWDHLAKVIEYLQANRTFERQTTPDLPAGVDRLALELVTQTFAEQNDVWSVLRTTYHPSVMYRVRLIVVRDEKPADVAQVTQPIVVTVRRRAS